MICGMTADMTIVATEVKTKDANTVLLTMVTAAEMLPITMIIILQSHITIHRIMSGTESAEATLPTTKTGTLRLILVAGKAMKEEITTMTITTMKVIHRITILKDMATTMRTPTPTNRKPVTPEDMTMKTARRLRNPDTDRATMHTSTKRKYYEKR
jgi:hypothetical protein